MTQFLIGTLENSSPATGKRVAVSSTGAVLVTGPTGGLPVALTVTQVNEAGVAVAFGFPAVGLINNGDTYITSETPDNDFSKLTVCVGVLGSGAVVTITPQIGMTEAGDASVRWSDLAALTAVTGDSATVPVEKNFPLTTPSEFIRFKCVVSGADCTQLAIEMFGIK